MCYDLYRFPGKLLRQFRNLKTVKKIENKLKKILLLYAVDFLSAVIIGFRRKFLIVMFSLITK